MAKGFIANFLVKVTSSGMGRAKKDVDELGTAADRLGMAHARASKFAGEHFNTTEKGIIGTANATKNFSKLAQGMNSSSGIVGAYATLAANIFAVSAAFNALRNAAQTQQVQAGLEAMGARMGLTLSIAAKNVKEISAYTLSTEQSMRATAQVMSAGLGTKNLERITQVAKDTSFALGRNMTDSMDRLTKGVVKLEPELLDELGLMTKLTEASNLYANSHHKSVTALTNFEKRQAFANAILTEGEAKFGDISKAAGNTRALDQLAATFSDLIYAGLSLINKVALPLANVFGSKGVLFGGMLLFASSIRKQLLPGLGNMAQSASRTAESMKELAIEQAKSFQTQDESTTRFFQRYVSRVAKGKDASIQFEKANKALTTALRDEAPEFYKTATNPQELKDAQEFEQATRRELKVLQEVEIARQRANRATLEYAAIGEASAGKVGSAFKFVKAAISTYRVELELASVQSKLFGTTTLKSLNSVKAGIYGLTLSIKVLGAAFLNMIPIIGQIIFVVSLLWAGFDKLRDWYNGAAITNYNKALQDQVEILNNVGKTVENVNRVAKSGIPVRLKEQQIWEAIGNSVTENIDAYQTLADTRNKTFSGTTSFKFEDTPEYKTLNVLTHAYPQALGQIQRGLEARHIDKNILQKPDKMLTVTELKAIGDVINNDLNKGLPQLGQAVQALGQAFDATGKAINDFNLAAVPNTPYDQVVKNFNNITDSMYEAATAASTLGDLQARTAAGIASTPQEIRNFLAPDLQNTIKDYETLETKIREIQKAGQEVSKEDSNKFGILEKTLSLRSYEVIAVQKQFVVAQAVTRETQGLVAIEQARLSKLNSYTALSAQGIIRRREAENRIIGLQIKQLDIQKSIIDNQLRLQKIQADMAKNDLMYQEARLGLMKDQNSLNEEQIYKTAIQRLNDIQDQINSGQGNTVALNAQAEEWRKLLTLTKDYANVRNSITEQEAASSALSKQIQAQQIGMTSKAAMAAEGAAVAAQSEADARDSQNKVISQSITLRDTLLAIQTKEQGRVTTLAEEYNQMVTNQTLATKTAKAAAEAQTAAQISQLLSQRQLAKEQKDPQTVAILDTRVLREKELLTIQLNQIDATNRLAILDKFAFDTQSEGLKIQQESLQYAQKYLDVMSDTANLRQESANLDRQIARRRSGAANNRYDQMADEIRAARAKYEEAIREATIRKATITLEFALLDAQREQTLLNAQVQRAIIGEQTEMGKQLTAVITNIQSAAGLIQNARDNALAGVDQTVNNARKAYLLSRMEDRGVDSIASRQRARADYFKELNTKPQTQATNEFATHIAPLINTQTELVKITTDLVNVNKQIVANAEKTGAANITRAVAGSLQEAARYATQQGFRVSEMAGYGGVGAGHKGLGHKEGRAFDMNIGRGNTEWNDPQMKARMDQMADYYRKLGFTVLWGVKDHFDHMHVEIPKGAARIAKDTSKAIIDTVQEPATVAIPAINQITSEVAKVAEEAIVVTAKGPRQPTAVENAFAQFKDTTTVPGGMLETFQNMSDTLGPQGNIVPTIITGINNIGDSYTHLLDVLHDPERNFASVFEAGAAVASSAFNTISGVLKATSDAQIANIDAEIAAEQRRDGKSAESLAKISSLQKKKDAEAKKAFNVQKKLMIAQAVMSTATAIAGQLASPPVGPWNIALAAMMGALGAAQIAVIAGTSYQGSADTTAGNLASAQPAAIKIGSQGNTVDLAKSNPNPGGELGYLRGQQGIGTNASNYRVVGSAYGGPIPRGYGNVAYDVGEHGPERINPVVPMTVRPSAEIERPQQLGPVHFNINAIDAKGVQEVLTGQRGHIIGMLREAANANGVPFLEDVNTNVYTSPRIEKL
jgi:hypothetical protein